MFFRSFSSLTENKTTERKPLRMYKLHYFTREMETGRSRRQTLISPYRFLSFPPDKFTRAFDNLVVAKLISFDLESSGFTWLCFKMEGCRIHCLFFFRILTSKEMH